MLVPGISDYIENIKHYRCPYCNENNISRIIRNPSTVYEDLFSGGIAIHRSEKTKIEYICPKCKTQLGYDWDIRTMQNYIDDNCRYSYDQYDAEICASVDWYVVELIYSDLLEDYIRCPTEATKKAIKVAEDVIDAVFSDLHKEDKYYRSFEEAKKDIIDRYSKKIPKEYRFTINSIEVNGPG